MASPASAASQGAAICGGKYYFNNNTAAVQVDNCPGSGASWGWVWANDDWSWADLNVRLTDGTQTTVSTDGGTAKSKTFNADIASWQICGHYWSWVGWPHYTDTCSAWFS
ncbi:hypothetical protein ACFYY2_01180 [Streptomyces sp. NPDC001822]|uniref:hypothetical protein n=1 Tax=Streptomyces sp. NPDC001822 TaxID=3364614 RepID=UPI0036912A59